MDSWNGNDGETKKYVWKNKLKVRSNGWWELCQEIGLVCRELLKEKRNVNGKPELSAAELNPHARPFRARKGDTASDWRHIQKIKDNNGGDRDDEDKSRTSEDITVIE